MAEDHQYRRKQADEAKLRYADYSIYLNYMYAKRHGYDFKLYVNPDFAAVQKRSPAWIKLYFLRSLLKNYDYVFGIDMDAYVFDQSTPILQFIDSQLTASGNLPFGTSNFVLAFSLEPELEFSKNTRYNSGVFVAKNSPEAFRLLETWWMCPHKKFGYGRYIWVWPRDQMCLHWASQFFPSAIYGIDPSKFYGANGKFLRHITGRWPEEQLPAMQKGFIAQAMMALDDGLEKQVTVITGNESLPV